jgi:hypothetical protein
MSFANQVLRDLMVTGTSRFVDGSKSLVNEKNMHIYKIYPDLKEQDEPN